MSAGANLEFFCSICTRGKASVPAHIHEEALFELEKEGNGVFKGYSPSFSWKRIFGGQILGQALAASAQTVTDLPPHSLHAYFLEPGTPEMPLFYTVETLRDGKRFSVREIKVSQNDKLLCVVTASFHENETSPFFHHDPMPLVPQPESLPDEATVLEHYLPRAYGPLRTFYENNWLIDIRPVEWNRYLERTEGIPAFNIWMRSKMKKTDPTHQRCLLAYASDMTLLDVPLIPYGHSIIDQNIQSASLDHVMWFHRSFSFDDWVLFSQKSPSAHGARALSYGQFFSRSGELIASVAQEGLLRKRSSGVFGRES
jgi:acyl-CoA thioesterase-2